MSDDENKALTSARADAPADGIPISDSATQALANANIAAQKRSRLQSAQAVAKRQLEKLSQLARSVDRWVKTLLGLGVLGALGVFAALSLLIGSTSTLQLSVLSGVAVVLSAPLVVLRIYHKALCELIELPKMALDMTSQVQDFFTQHPAPDDKKTKKPLRIFAFARTLRNAVEDIRGLLKPDSPILILANPLWGILAALSLALSLVFVLLAPPLLLLAWVF